MPADPGAGSSTDATPTAESRGSVMRWPGLAMCHNGDALETPGGTHVPFGLPTIDHAQEAGRSLAATYPTIWDPDALVSERIEPAVDAWLAQQPARRSAQQRVWITLLVVFIVLVVAPPALVWLTPYLGVVVVPPLDPTVQWWIVGAWAACLLGVIVSVLGVAVSRRRAARARRVELTALRRAILAESLRAIDMRRDQARAERATPPAPSRLPYGVSARGMVELAAAWLRHLGAATTVAPERVDGIDITCRRFVARVVGEHEDAAAAVREVAGVAAARPQARGLVFLPNLAPSAATVAFADATHTALLILGPETGTLVGANDVARALLSPVSPEPARADTRAHEVVRA